MGWRRWQWQPASWSDASAAAAAAKRLQLLGHTPVIWLLLLAGWGGGSGCGGNSSQQAGLMCWLQLLCGRGLLLQHTTLVICFCLDS
jgi:hypothetical protein